MFQKGDKVVLVTENLSTLKIHKLTQEQYDRALSNGDIDESALYLTPDNSEEIESRIEALENQIKTKQNTITGTAGQFVVIGADGNLTTRTLANAEEVDY